MAKEIFSQLQEEAHDEKVAILGASGQKSGSQNQLGGSTKQTQIAEDSEPPEAIHLLAVKQHRTLTTLPAVACGICGYTGCTGLRVGPVGSISTAFKTFCLFLLEEII